MKKVFIADTKQELDDKLNEFMENHDVYDWGFVTIVTEKVADELANDEYHWKATLTPKRADEAAKDLLIENGYVNFFVSGEEVRGVATNMQRELTDEELADVVEFLSHNDLETGLCELAIEGAISEACPDATDQEWEDEDDSGIEYLRSIGK